MPKDEEFPNGWPGASDRSEQESMRSDFKPPVGHSHGNNGENEANCEACNGPLNETED
jgi:hypothetical protein